MLATGKVAGSKAKAALDQAFPAGQESDDNEVQSILRVQPLLNLFEY